MFIDEENVAHALHFFGYESPDGDAIIRSFQRHWNLVISRIANVPARYENVPFTYLPQGNLRVDGKIGPHTLNAIEVALINQRLNPQLSWIHVIKMTMGAGDGRGKQKLYNAIQGM